VVDRQLSLQKMQSVGIIVLAVLTIGSAIFMSISFALSVLVGGVISIASFWVSNKDILGLIDSVTSLALPEERKAQAHQGQKGYLLRFWVRIVIIGVLLLFLIKGKVVNIFGLILGLSTVVVTVTVISLNVISHYLFRGRR
jgi:hypothetical protein